MYKFYCDDALFYMSGVDEKEYYIIEPKLEHELGKNSSFSFTLPSTNIIYNNIQKLKSIITVFDDDYELFRGRVLYDEKDFYNRKVVTCEGELAFLLDSVQRPYTHQGTIEDFFNYLIENHNSQVEAQKQFKVGNITVTDNNDYINRESANYDKTYNVITDKLINTHGGYLKTREVDGERYIDYLEVYGEVNDQVIEFGVNLLDIKEYITAENIITCLIPLGAKQENSEERLTIESVNGGLDYIQNQTAIELFGRIWATQEWDDVTIASNLLTKGKEYLDSNIEMSVTLTLKAIDLHLIDFNTERLKLGDKVRVVSLPHNIDKYFECTKVTIDFQNPNNNEYTFGSSYTTLTDTSSNINNTIVNITDNVITSKIEPFKEQITAEVKDSLTQEELMNIITNNGQAEGIYLVNGQIWIKGSYINVDKLSAIVANLGDITGGSININDMFIVDSQGNMISVNGVFTGKVNAESGQISGFTIEDDKLSASFIKTFDYTSDDLTTIQNIIMNGTTPTDEQLARYDLNGDGKITSADHSLVKKIINAGNQITVKFLIYPVFEYSGSEYPVLEVSVEGFNTTKITQLGRLFSDVGHFGSIDVDRYITAGNYQDSGWLQLELTSNFTYYTENDDNLAPRYRKVGSVVTVAGDIKPTKTLTGGTTKVTIATLPVGYRPKNRITQIMQGSTTNVWQLEINTNGNITFSRYRSGSTYNDCTTSHWLPFNSTFLVSDE